MARAKKKRAPTPADFDRLIRDLGKLVVGRAKEELPTKRGKPGWASAFVVARWFDAELPSWAGKMRIVPPTGEPVGVQITFAMEDIIQQVSAMRREVFPEPWYRLTLTVSPARNRTWS